MLIGVILAGGQSKRFRGNKLIASVDGKAVINRVFEELSSLVDSIYISIRYEKQRDILERYITKSASEGEYEFVLDYKDGEGPLNAILTSLDVVLSDEYIIVPGDLPWIKTESLKKLIDLGRVNKCTATIPIWGNGWSESLIVYFNKKRCTGMIRILGWLRRSGRATDIQRTVPRLTLVPIFMLTDDPIVFVHINTRDSLLNPKPRNPLEGPVKEVISIDRTMWSKTHFIQALEAASDGDNITALKHLVMELNEYIPFHLMQLIKHTLSDAIQLTD